jgi:hypothetical protein
MQLPHAVHVCHGIDHRATRRLTFAKVAALGPPVPSSSPPGVAYVSCSGAGFCAAVPNLNQVAPLDGSAWPPPDTIEAAQGIAAVDCTGPTFCITISCPTTTYCVAVDRSGNAFVSTG